MSLPDIKYCPGTLAPGFQTYSRTCLNRLFSGRKVHHVLPYDSPSFNEMDDRLFEDNRKRMSISGVQEKFSLKLEKNKLRLTTEDEKGTYILKPIPGAGKKAGQIPANEHLTMQIARQVYGMETAENALIFFRNGAPAYITRRFDVQENGWKTAQEDFASLAGVTPQTHGEHYKYRGNYLDLFRLLEKYVPAYKTESLKLYRLLMFNYLFSNGDAHLKNFSLVETRMGDYRMSPAYDLLNSRIHIDNPDFALEDGLLPGNLAKGNISRHFRILAGEAGIDSKQADRTFELFETGKNKVESLISASYLDDKTKRNYWQDYMARLKKLSRASYIYTINRL